MTLETVPTVFPLKRRKSVTSHLTVRVTSAF